MTGQPRPGKRDPFHERDTTWQNQAACAGHDPEMWSPPDIARYKHTLARHNATRQAKNICNQCPVKTQCLDYALKQDIRYGIWGGYDQYERGHLTGKRARR
jgi:WhiB family redox-sensing transcriptional regulator